MGILNISRTEFSPSENDSTQVMLVTNLTRQMIIERKIVIVRLHAAPPSPQPDRALSGRDGIICLHTEKIFRSSRSPFDLLYSCIYKSCLK